MTQFLLTTFFQPSLAHLQAKTSASLVTNPPRKTFVSRSKFHPGLRPFPASLTLLDNSHQKLPLLHFPTVNSDSNTITCSLKFPFLFLFPLLQLPSSLCSPAAGIWREPPPIRQLETNFLSPTHQSS